MAEKAPSTLARALTPSLTLPPGGELGGELARVSVGPALTPSLTLPSGSELGGVLAGGDLKAKATKAMADISTGGVPVSAGLAVVLPVMFPEMDVDELGFLALGSRRTA